MASALRAVVAIYRRAFRAALALWGNRLARRREPGDLTSGGRAGAGWRAPFLMDLRFAARSLRHAPWYAATVVGVLAAGVALTTTAFAVVDGVLFKPLPYPRAHELYLVRSDLTTAPSLEPPAVMGWDLAAWADAVPELAVTTVTAAHAFATMAGRDRSSMDVDEHFFDVLGVRPLLGGLASEDFAWPPQSRPTGSGSVRPVIISYALWQGAFGGDPNVAGRTVMGHYSGYRIRGVLPRDFVFPLDVGDVPPDLLTPVSAREMRERGGGQMIVRVRRAADLPGVRDRLLGATRRRAAMAPPAMNSHERALFGDQWQPRFDDVRLLPIVEHLGARQRPAFALVFAGAAVLLLLACVNVAGLAAARSMDRRRELAVRRALGASTWALARGLVIEVGLIAVASTGLAVLLVRPLFRWTLDLLPASIALFKTPDIDVRVFGAAALFTLAIVALVVIWPARVAHRVSLLAESGHVGSTATRVARRSNFVLVALQVGLCFVLLTAGGLAVTSLARTWRNDPGYDRDRIVLLPSFLEKYSDSADNSDQINALIDALGRVPGAETVAYSNSLLFPLRFWGTDVIPKGSKERPAGTQSTWVSASFFNVMGLRLVDGRWPAPGEWGKAAPVAIVSQTAARTLWPGRNALGRVLVAERPDPDRPMPERTVIGVVADTRYRALDQDPWGDIYLPLSGAFGQGTYGTFLLVRTTGEAEAILPSLVAAATAHGFWVERPSTLRDALFVSVKHRALPAWLFGSLGLVALPVLGVGVLGLIAMAAGRRTREVGIRIALGATSGRIVGLMVREQLTAVGVGLLAGGVISLWTVRGLESQLYGVRPYDPEVWGAVALTVVAIAVGATMLPALGATRVDPVVILRAE
jgi:predicted permease